jgi:ribose 5-phosphate isomerase B
MFDKTKVLPIASDHGGFEMKEYIKKELTLLGYNIKDYGTFSELSVDYPDYIHPISSAINKGEFDLAIIFCGSGNGAQITANKYSNVRAGLCWSVEQAELTRLHNDANILSIPGRFVNFNLGLDIAKTFLSTNFEGGRHQQRVDKISKLEK